MSCPKCGGAQECPCANCAERNAGKVVWKWDETGEVISCGHCGHTMHAEKAATMRSLKDLVERRIEDDRKFYSQQQKASQANPRAESTDG